MNWFQNLKKRSLLLTRNACIGALLAVSLSGCVSDMGLDDLSSRQPELSSKMLAEMSKKGMAAGSPVLIRIFKQESELEVWKVDRSGRYALLKTYPMCRWSGKLGPKVKEGDRQAPEGFYHVSKGMLNPKSQYYVSFNLGYPNRLESALGYTGEALMVHGACSSSGCFALTDQGVGEIYAIVAKALSSGQERFQVQAYPFRMTTENMALHKDNENLSFWRTLKEGYDLFELTRQQPKVSVCGRRYMFNRNFAGGEPRYPLEACPESSTSDDPGLIARVAEETQRLEAAIQQAGRSTVSSYVDGGMHPSFRALLKKDGPDRLAARISGTKYPVSRPDAALADPFQIKKARSGERVIASSTAGD